MTQLHYLGSNLTQFLKNDSATYAKKINLFFLEQYYDLIMNKDACSISKPKNDSDRWEGDPCFWPLEVPPGTFASNLFLGGTNLESYM